MSISRFGALDTILNRSKDELDYVDIPDAKISEFFGF